jgi:hypothetical protein
VVEPGKILEAVQVDVDAPSQGIDTRGSEGSALAVGLKLSVVFDLEDVATVCAAEQTGALEVFDIDKEIEFGSQRRGDFRERPL